LVQEEIPEVRTQNFQVEAEFVAQADAVRGRKIQNIPSGYSINRQCFGSP
jgi:hypothetical protein